MSVKFFSKLSQNFLELLDNDENYYDITIEVASNNRSSNTNDLVHIRLPNISPEIFQIILRYIYGGILSLNEQDTSDILKILAAADELCLQELIDYLQGDDLQMKEVEVWDRVLEWGLAQNSTLISDPDTWTDDDYRMMENTLQRCLPLIRFFSLSSKEFLQNIDPYKKLLNSQLYKDLLNSYMNPDSIPNDNISLPRNIHIDEVIDSTI
ncbi:BTB/POZ protein [Rhizophagus irregularis DAOM 181602=DAOM 197198]|nr:BTB/POZ protein [Rhizophagus irregularis DAOM 181602=DAOM 197198]